ncbi:response regulator [Nanoarchaeota archaeon]
MGILIIDDQEWTITKLRELLGGKGIETDYTSTLEDSLDQLGEEAYDALIIDYDMDVLNGEQLIRLIKGEYIVDGETKTLDDDITYDEIKESDSEIAGVFEKYFIGMENYKEFVSRFKDTTFILFSGNSAELEQAKLPSDVFVVYKNNDSDNYSAERKIIDYLIEQRALK